MPKSRAKTGKQQIVILRWTLIALAFALILWRVGGPLLQMKFGSKELPARVPTPTPGAEFM